MPAGRSQRIPARARIWRLPDVDGIDDLAIRLLKVVPTLMCGGTENQFMALGRSLDPDRFDLEFACLRRWGGSSHELDERRIPLLEYSISTFRSVNAIAQQARLARDIRRAAHRDRARLQLLRQRVRDSAGPDRGGAGRHRVDSRSRRRI